MKTIQIIAVIFSFIDLNTFAQESNVKNSVYDGILAVGYVDQGAYLNFTGPNINMTYGDSKFILGMLPSLRFKEDNAAVRNSFVTPNLGVGITYCYKHFAVQVPVYYNSKTATQHGKWHLGIGIGYRINKLTAKK